MFEKDFCFQDCLRELNCLPGTPFSGSPLNRSAGEKKEEANDYGLILFSVQ